jgi:acetolactate synthase I/II/III large subunit
MRDGDATDTTKLAAAAYLERLAERGVEYIFANAGTDFAPIIEAVARNRGAKFPKFVTCPHENVAVGMAHGYYRTSGKIAAVMVHVTVGTANALNNLMNASRDNVPILLAAGRTPLTEIGHHASRNGAIHWGQESFDQGGMVREYVKWDYELRTGQPVASVVDRALDIAMSEPRGPVYLTLPREVLANPPVAPRRNNDHGGMGASPPAPAKGPIEHAAKLLANAEFPLIITSSGGRSPESFRELSALAADFALPVIQYNARDLNIPTNHPMNLGFDIGPYLKKADVILVLDSVVPWMPSQMYPKDGAKIIHISSDPLAARYPYREIETDLLITGENALAAAALRDAMGSATKGKEAALESRRKAIAAIQEERTNNRRAAIEKMKTQKPMSTTWVTHCISEAKAKDAIISNELGILPNFMEMTEYGSFIGTPLSGGLGMGLGSALGAKLAAPNREVIACVGDGSYMFGNPLPYHFVQAGENLPTLTVISNNSSWHAVRASTLSVYPNGDASKANVMALTELKPSPAFEKTTETCGGYGEKVENPAELPAALKRALDKVRSGTPATLNVVTQGR